MMQLADDLSMALRSLERLDMANEIDTQSNEVTKVCYSILKNRLRRRLRIVSWLDVNGVTMSLAIFVCGKEHSEFVHIDDPVESIIMTRQISKKCHGGSYALSLFSPIPVYISLLPWFHFNILHTFNEKKIKPCMCIVSVHAYTSMYVKARVLMKVIYSTWSAWWLIWGSARDACMHSIFEVTDLIDKLPTSRCDDSKFTDQYRSKGPHCDFLFASPCSTSMNVT